MVYIIKPTNIAPVGNGFARGRARGTWQGQRCVGEGKADQGGREARGGRGEGGSSGWKKERWEGERMIAAWVTKILLRGGKE